MWFITYAWYIKLSLLPDNLIIHCFLSIKKGLIDVGPHTFMTSYKTMRNIHIEATWQFSMLINHFIINCTEAFETVLIYFREFTFIIKSNFSGLYQVHSWVDLPLFLFYYTPSWSSIDQLTYSSYVFEWKLTKFKQPFKKTIHQSAHTCRACKHYLDIYYEWDSSLCVTSALEFTLSSGLMCHFRLRIS